MDAASFVETPIARKCLNEPKRKDFGLTALEKQIITLLLAGYTSRESGQKIGVTQHSIRRHLKSIIVKLGVSNRLELVLFAVYHRLIDPPQKLPRLTPRLTEKSLSQTGRPRHAA